MNTQDKKADVKIFHTKEEVQKLYTEQGQKVVVFRGTVYDVGEYMHTHPGGEDILADELGKVIDEPFEEAEHSKSALKIFLDLPVIGKLKDSEEQSTASSDEKEGKSGKGSAGPEALFGLQLSDKFDFDYNKGLLY